MGSPAIIEPVMQKDIYDCGVASLAMLLGLPYSEVRKAASDIYKERLKEGLDTRSMIRIAKELGHVLKSVPYPNPDLEPQTGILGTYDHYVMLFEGVVYNPADGLLYDVDTYLASRKRVKPMRLLIS